MWRLILCCILMSATAMAITYSFKMQRTWTIESSDNANCSVQIPIVVNASWQKITELECTINGHVIKIEREGNVLWINNSFELQKKAEIRCYVKGKVSIKEVFDDGIENKSKCAFPLAKVNGTFLEMVAQLCNNIHNYLEYDARFSNKKRNVGEIIKERKGVCKDFAKVFEYACSCLGIGSKYVVGYLIKNNETEAHAWNLVERRGQEILVDPTLNEVGTYSVPKIAIMINEKDPSVKEIVKIKKGVNVNITRDVMTNVSDVKIERVVKIGYVFSEKKEKLYISLCPIQKNKSSVLMYRVVLPMFKQEKEVPIVVKDACHVIEINLSKKYLMPYHIYDVYGGMIINNRVENISLHYVVEGDNGKNIGKEEVCYGNVLMLILLFSFSIFVKEC